MIKVLEIKSEECEDWLLNLHYAKRMPMIIHSFGLYIDKILKGIMTFGLPPSPDLCKGLCGEEYRHDVLELNRLILEDNKKNLASFFISKTLKLLPKPKIIVSYADTSMNHSGYIYQASNFIYTGLSTKRKDWQLKEGNKHSRNLSQQFTLEERQNSDKFVFVERPQKHRYVYFLGSKVQRKSMIKALNYKQLPYPKKQNINYEINKKPKTQGILF